MYQSNFRQFTAQLLLAVLLFGTITNITTAQRVQDTGMTVGEADENLNPLPPCAGGIFKTAGNSNVDGPNGNIRTYNFGSVSVRASAFARKVATGEWETAYLGAYGPGLGVTDNSETGANDTHKVDNNGTYKNYVLFEFNQQVVIDKVALDAISSDSDMTAWIGNSTDPYNNHLTLNDAMLAGFGRENNDGAGSPAARWADINAAEEIGNVLVVAANPDQSNDWFKIEALEIKCPPAPCPSTTITTTGDSAGDGPDGNIRTFSSGSVSVKASAFSRMNSNGSWETSYLGVYSPGLGVTDRGEGDGSNNKHKVDNIGDRKNYVLFEFNQDVVVDQLVLDAIGDAAGNDSDITVWIGSSTDPYMNHITLNDAVLAGFGPPESNDTTSTTTRTADINAAQKVGNILVVAASVSDQDPEDAFKIKQVKLKCPTTSAKGRVTIIKEVFTTTGNSSSQLFNFTANNLGNFNFNLKDENVVGPDRFTNANITAFGPSNPITVTESVTQGWTLLDIVCSETGGMSNTTANVAGRTANIIVEPGETVTCIFRNSQATPSAAFASVNGRALTIDGIGISGAILTLEDVSTGESRVAITNPFGYYTFDNLEIGGFYVITIAHKRYFFEQNTRSFTLMDDLTSVDFVQTF